MASQKFQISSLTAKRQKMMTALIASGFEIPDSDPSPGEEDGEDCKIARIPISPRPIRKGNLERPGGPRGAIV